MSKRVKKVFTNIDTIAHLWASQAQDSARNSRPNFYFEGTSIYSYGSHFVAGKIYTMETEKVVLVNSRYYSVTTAKHLSTVRRAITHLKSFEVPVPADFSDSRNLTHLENNIVDNISSVLDRSQGDNMSQVLKAVDGYNSYITTFQLPVKQFQLDPVFRAILVELAHAKRLKYFDKLETKKEKERRDNAVKIAAYHETARYWVNHEMSDLEGYDKPAYIRLSKDGTEIETSHGAVVPLHEAKAFYRQLKAGNVVPGTKVGGFEFREIDGDTIKIGCHDLPIKAVDAIMSRFELLEKNIFELKGVA